MEREEMKDQEGGGESERQEAVDAHGLFNQIGGLLGGEEEERHVCTWEGKDRSCLDDTVRSEERRCRKD